jgi:Transposase IS116/IS110/IS902 family
VCLSALAAQLRKIKEQILGFDRMITAWHRSSETSRRLDDCPGVGPALATALVASVADPKAFRSGRNFSAWIGLVPKQHSSGGKGRLGSISKQGDRYLRSLFVAGALAVIRYAKIHGTKHRPWLAALLAQRRNAISIVEIVSAWSFRELELSCGASMVSISSMFVSMAPIRILRAKIVSCGAGRSSQSAAVAASMPTANRAAATARSKTRGIRR